MRPRRRRPVPRPAAPPTLSAPPPTSPPRNTAAQPAASPAALHQPGRSGFADAGILEQWLDASHALDRFPLP